MSNELVNLRYCKVRDVESPTKAFDTDAGIDFYVPKATEEYVGFLRSQYPNTGVFVRDSSSNIAVSPHKTIVIPSGIHVDVPKRWALVAFNRSGIATKRGLSLLACVVDSGYQGEVFFSLKNVGSDLAWVSFGEKIVQMLLLPVPKVTLQEVDNGLDSLYTEGKSSRRDGALGSTG